MATKNNLADIYAIKERVANKTYKQFREWLTLNGGNIFEENKESFSFSYNSISATITKESHLNGEFELYDDENDWIGVMYTEITIFKDSE